MAGKRSQPVHSVRLSHQAMFAAERLSEIAGIPASELLEVVLLELVASGNTVEASARGKRSSSKTVAPRPPARVIPIGSARQRLRRAPAVGADDLRQRSAALCRRAESARAAASEARRKSIEILDSEGVNW
jgi:hypothetical protein